MSGENAEKAARHNKHQNGIGSPMQEDSGEALLIEPDFDPYMETECFWYLWQSRKRLPHVHPELSQDQPLGPASGISARFRHSESP